MGQSQSAHQWLRCCSQAPAAKYEVNDGNAGSTSKGQHLPGGSANCSFDKRKDASAKSRDVSGKAEKPAGGPAQDASPVSAASPPGGAFVTTDPNLVAPELAPQAGLPYQFQVCGPPLPPCDDLRLRTVNALKNAGNIRMDADAIDAPPDPEIASILKLVQSIFEAPAALVALFDDRRIFIRDAEGAFKRGDFPWRWSFCGWTMASRNDQIMVIPDALKDSRFQNNAMVRSGPGVRFYCGTPLIASNGHRIGTLCFADTKPREFDASRCIVLNNLAELVVRHLEKDIALQLRSHDNQSLAAAYGHLRRTLDCFDHCVALVDTGSAGWRILFVNNPCCKALGIERESLQGTFLSRLLSAVDGSMLPGDLHQLQAEGGKEFTVQGVLSQAVMEELADGKSGDQQGRRFVLTFRPASREDLDEGTLSIGVPSYITAAAKDAGKEEDQQQEGSEDGSSGCTAEQRAVQRRPDRLYFMLLQDAAKLEAERAAAKAKAAEAAASMAGTSSITGSSSLGQHSSQIMGLDRELYAPPESIGGLTMGHLLGKGAYGSVYYGTWYSTPVAVKIIDEELAPGAESIAPPIEAILSKELRHPHVVATLRCARRVVGPTGSTHSVSGSISAAIAAARGSLQKPASATVAPGVSNNFSDDTALTRSAGNDMQSGTVVSGALSGVTDLKDGSAAAPEAGNALAAQSSSSAATPATGVTNSASSSTPAGTATPFTEEWGSVAAAQGGVAAAQGSVLAAQGSQGQSQLSSAAGSQSKLPQSDSESVSTGKWAIINLGANPGTGAGFKRRSSAHATEPSAEQAAAGAAGGEQRVLDDSSAAESELYDTFDNVDNSGVSPFLMPPGSGAPVGSGHTGSRGSNGPQALGGGLVRHQTWLIMEYCDKGCLQDAIDRGWLRTVNSQEESLPNMTGVLATAVEIASALSFLHAKDIVHGDMSAWNVMLCTSGSTASVGGRGFVAKIADFGLARHMDIRTKIQTRTYGTLTHMPAETLRDGVVSKSVDVYSFGVLLWQLYTGSRPWAGLRHGQIIVMVVTQGARLRFPVGCPAAYEELANACMSPNPGDRPTVEEVLSALEVIRGAYASTSGKPYRP